MQIPNQHGTNPEDLKITKDEFKKIEKAMKRPEFAELMGDYMKEISDPKNREEYDEYLKQLERDAELPKGMKLIKPDPHFCVKTTIWQKTNRKHEQKFFVNICSTSVIDKPSNETITQNGQTGQNWKIPYSIGKIRYDQDKKQHVCNTVDVAFHPQTIGLCYKMPGFQNLVCSTALEASGKQLGERNEDISKDFKVLKHTKCKGGEPALLPVRLDKKGKPSNELDGRQGGQANAQTKLQKDINQMKEESQKNKEEQKQKEQKIDEEEEEPQKESNEIESTAVSQPKYRFIYSYPVEYSDFLDSRPNQGPKLPNQLACELKMQKVAAMKEIQLDLSNQNLLLDVPNKYYLDIKLPYPIEQAEATAKFETKTKTLKIRAPVQKEYLKQKYQEELEKIRQEQQQLKNDDEEENTQPTIQQEIQYQFIPQQENTNLEEQKPLVEEIENNEQINLEQNQEIQIEEKKQENYIQLTYHQRKDADFFFIIIKIKGYQKESLKIEYNDTNLCLLHNATVDGVLNHEFLHLKLENPINYSLYIDLVTDFVILKLKSDQIDNIILQEQQYINAPFSQLIQLMEEIRQQKIQQQQNKEDEELEIPVSKEQQIPEEQQMQEENKKIEQNKKIEYVEQQNDEDDQQETKAEVQELNESQKVMNQRKNIQFLRFQELMPDIFEID